MFELIAFFAVIGFVVSVMALAVVLRGHLGFLLYLRDLIISIALGEVEVIHTMTTMPDDDIEGE